MPKSYTHIKYCYTNLAEKSDEPDADPSPTGSQNGRDNMAAFSR